MFHRLFSRRGANRKNTAAVDSGIDEACNYCPQCGEPFRAEIERCAHCLVPLISATEKRALLGSEANALTAHGAEISADDELVTIQHGKLGQLKTVQQLLQADHVPSILGGGDNRQKG